MKKVLFQTILILAPVVVLAQKNEKETPSLGNNKNNTLKLFLDNSKAPGTNNLLPDNFPAVNGKLFLNNTATGSLYQNNIPSKPVSTNNGMPCLIPDMTAVAPMPVVSGLTNNRLPEPMPGAFIYNKKK